MPLQPNRRPFDKLRVDASVEEIPSPFIGGTMSLTLAELRKHATRVRHSRAQFIAAQARLWRASATPGLNTDRLERAMRHLETTRQELQAAFNEGLGLLDAQAVKLVRQFKDESAALEQVLEAEVARRGAQLRRQISKHLKT